MIDRWLVLAMLSVVVPLAGIFMFVFDLDDRFLIWSNQKIRVLSQDSLAGVRNYLKKPRVKLVHVVLIMLAGISVYVLFASYKDIRSVFLFVSVPIVVRALVLSHKKNESSVRFDRVKDELFKMVKKKKGNGFIN